MLATTHSQSNDEILVLRSLFLWALALVNDSKFYKHSTFYSLFMYFCLTFCRQIMYVDKQNVKNTQFKIYYYLIKCF